MQKPQPINGKRELSLELLRIFAAFGVVAFHAKVSMPDIPYAGLVAFVILSTYVDSKYKADQRRSILDIARVFLVPWVFWMLIYGVLNLLIGKSFLPLGLNFVEGILAGTSMHLWYMPFMFLVLVLINLIKLRVPIRIMYIGSILIVIPFLALPDQWAALVQKVTVPYAQWLHAFPAVLIGIILGLASRLRYGWHLSLVIISVGIGFLYSHKIPGIEITYTFGVFMVVISILVARTSWFPVKIIGVQEIASSTLGIYLIHMIMLAVSSRIFGKETWSTACFAFFLSLSIVLLIKKVIPKSKLVLG